MIRCWLLREFEETTLKMLKRKLEIMGCPRMAVDCQFSFQLNDYFLTLFLGGQGYGSVGILLKMVPKVKMVGI